MRITTTIRNYIGDYIGPLLNGGTIEFYTAGSGRPAGPGTAISDQTLLGTCTFNATAFGSASNGVITANAITQDSSADATGTCTWARLKSSGGTAHIDMSVGTSGTDIIVGSTSFVSGLPILFTSLTITVPAET